MPTNKELLELMQKSPIREMRNVAFVYDQKNLTRTPVKTLDDLEDYWFNMHEISRRVTETDGKELSEKRKAIDWDYIVGATALRMSASKEWNQGSKSFEMLCGLMSSGEALNRIVRRETENDTEIKFGWIKDVGTNALIVVNQIQRFGKCVPFMLSVDTQNEFDRLTSTTERTSAFENLITLLFKDSQKPDGQKLIYGNDDQYKNYRLLDGLVLVNYPELYLSKNGVKEIHPTLMKTIQRIAFEAMTKWHGMTSEEATRIVNTHLFERK